MEITHMDFITFCQALSKVFGKESAVKFSHLQTNGKHYYCDPGGSEAVELDATTIKVTLHNPFLETDEVKYIKVTTTTVQKTEFVVV
jgi:hypothetical protein